MATAATETTNDAVGPSAGVADPPVVTPRKTLKGILSGISALDAAVAASIFALLAALLTPLLAFGTLWLFAVFPWLRPWTPPEERRVSISNAVVAERRFVIPESGEEMTVVTFDAEAIGYAAHPIAVATLWLDAPTSTRVEDNFDFHAYLVSSAETNRSVGWLDVPYPILPRDVTGCLVLRVLLFLAPEGRPDLAQEPAIAEPSDRMQLLAYTDTPPFDPWEEGACDAMAGAATPEA